MNVREILEKQAGKYGDKPALVFRDQPVSFRQLNENVLKLANALAAQGVKPHDKIGIFLPNCPEYVYSYLACFCLGAVGVPLDFMLKNDELVSCLEHSETKVLIAAPKNEVSFPQIRAAVPS